MKVNISTDINTEPVFDVHLWTLPYNNTIDLVSYVLITKQKRKAMSYDYEKYNI